MDSAFSHDTFLSPFTWRYGSDAMRRVWSEDHRRRLWRRIWVSLAEVQHEAGLVRADQVEDLRRQQDKIDLPRAHALEAEIRHDLMAEVRTYAEQCPAGGAIIHLGATSMDIEDNADIIRMREALDLIGEQVADLLRISAKRIEALAHVPCMAFTHLQPAEPTTVGHRLAGYAQDLLEDYEAAGLIRAHLRGKGFKGAVGTGASYSELLEGTDLSFTEFEGRLSARLDLAFWPIATQTYPRRQDLLVLQTLASLAATLYRFAFDLRLLQSPLAGEWSEPFGAMQVGSSAMPFKRNPIHAENIDSLARYVAALPRVAWDNAAHNLLERTLDDSANRRLVLPEAFLAMDEILNRVRQLMAGFQLDQHAVRRTLETYGLFAATERVLIRATRKGGDRQALHEILRELSLRAWSDVREGKPNPLKELITTDARLAPFLSPDESDDLMNVENYVGDAPQRALEVVRLIQSRLGS